MRYLRFVILFLILCNIPSFTLVNLNSAAGTVSSYLTFFLIILYYFFSKKKKHLLQFIILGLLYFFISLIVDSQNAEYIVVTSMKYFIFIIAGTSIIKDTKAIEIHILLLLGSLSVIYESIFITDIGGRFSGFYLNPNGAGFVCIIGFCLSTSIRYKNLKVLGQILFSIAGFVTFSRTFLLLWILINIISFAISYKNIFKFIVGIVVFSLLLSFGDKLDFNIRRLEAFTGILDGKVSDEMKEDSRTLTWAAYYSKIYDSPVFGNGYLSFSGKTSGTDENAYSIQGVHNTFLMILGEAGFFVFIFFSWIYVSYLIKGFRLFRDNPVIFLVSFTLFVFLFTSHNFFDNYILLFFSVWLFFQIENSFIIRKAVGKSIRS